MYVSLNKRNNGLNILYLTNTLLNGFEETGSDLYSSYIKTRPANRALRTWEATSNLAPLTPLEVGINKSGWRRSSKIAEPTCSKTVFRLLLIVDQTYP